MKLFRIALLILIPFMLASCKKEKIVIPLMEINTPTDSRLKDVLFLDTANGFAVGGERFEHGELLATTDGGTTWTSDTLTDRRLNSIAFADDGNHGYIVGFAGYYLDKSSNQNSWDFRALENQEELHCVKFINENHGIAVGGGGFKTGVIYRFVNSNGNSDTLIFPVDHEMRDVVFLDEQTAIAVGYGIVMRSVDGGLNWQPNSVEGDFFYGIDHPTPQTGYVIGHYGKIIKTTDGGLNWSRLRKSKTIFGTPTVFRDVKFVDEDHGYIVGNSGLLWKTTNGGESWAEAESMPDVNFNSICIIEDHAFIAADEGRIFMFPL